MDFAQGLCGRVMLGAHGIQIDREEQCTAVDVILKLGFDHVHLFLDGFGPGFLPKVDSIGVVFVAALTVPGHGRIMEELVEPCADERIAAFDLVIEERKRQVGVEGFDPEAEPAELDGERIEVYTVDTAFDHIAAQDGFGAQLEVVVLQTAGQLFVRKQFSAILVINEFQDRLIPAVLNTIVDDQ
ncbi:MAG TPA: hypothetical protein PLD73_15690 [Candidatus Hydrogenedentes bacterium]|nr:hypothetical protein [Candidatus Hydrogenedentota bacterium]HPJ98761.1 hypothetical protein [Candidatus Hydrogenedentota bacterium]